MNPKNLWSGDAVYCSGLCAKDEAARFLFNQEAEDYFTHLAHQALKLQIDTGQSEKMRAARGIWFNEQLDQLPKEFDRFLAVEAVPDSSKKFFSSRFKYDPEKSISL
jgi:hypothetical protein